jgi:prolyl oligopeptidase
MKLKKQNVFDDFIAAAEWLISNKYTSTPSPRRAGRVGCSSELSDSAAICLERALQAVGLWICSDYKFTIGWAWVSDYGVDLPTSSRRSMPTRRCQHQAQPSYPPTLITTADHDDGVIPAHASGLRRYLRRAQAGPAPVLIRLRPGRTRQVTVSNSSMKSPTGGRF